MSKTSLHEKLWEHKHGYKLNTKSGRRGVREFQSRPVEEEKLLRVLEAELKAPSHNHLREWEFILIKDFEQRKRAVDLGVLKTQQDWHYIKLHRIRLAGLTIKPSLDISIVRFVSSI